MAVAPETGADIMRLDVRWQTGAPAADPVGENAATAAHVVAASGVPGVLGRDFTLPEISPQLRFPAGQAIG